MTHFFRQLFRPARIYLDYASITPTDPRVLKVMHSVYGTDVGNPSSLHKEGVRAAALVAESRTQIARVIHAHADEIVFTGTGTEANNLAIFGVVEARVHAGTPWSDIHLITSAIEHASVLECFRALEKRGAKLDIIGVTDQGVIDVEEFKKKLTPQTTLVSVQYVNNEIGTVQQLEDIVKAVRYMRKSSGSAYPYLHTDASQAFLYTAVNLEKLGVDLLTLDGHKVYGPKGIGLLYIRRGVVCAPYIYGGEQEKGLRSGTENVPGIVGFSTALTLALDAREAETQRLTDIREYMIKELCRKVPTLKVHGDQALVSPHIVNVEFPGYDAETLMLRLDAHGIACSTKSSCLRDSDESYVLAAIGADSRSSLRLSLGRYTTRRDISRLVTVLDTVLPLSKSTLA